MKVDSWRRSIWVSLLKIVRPGCGCIEQRPTNPPTIFFIFSCSIGVCKDKTEEKLRVRTILGRSNTARHRHRPVDIVLLGAPKSAGGPPRLCMQMQYGVSQNDLLDK